jgi:ssDNA-binding Zn-finger/Zn-ribbon topoisomerase 1
MELTEEHIKELFFNLHKKADQPREDIVVCSLCGAEMIKRKSKFNNGYWWGCSNFPRCRNTFK